MRRPQQRLMLSVNPGCVGPKMGGSRTSSRRTRFISTAGNDSCGASLLRRNGLALLADEQKNARDERKERNEEAELPEADSKESDQPDDDQINGEQEVTDVFRTIHPA